jgi:hypothetical protein
MRLARYMVCLYCLSRAGDSGLLSPESTVIISTFTRSVNSGHPNLRDLIATRDRLAPGIGARGRPLSSDCPHVRGYAASTRSYPGPWLRQLKEVPPRVSFLWLTTRESRTGRTSGDHPLLVPDPRQGPGPGTLTPPPGRSTCQGRFPGGGSLRPFG